MTLALPIAAFTSLIVLIALARILLEMTCTVLEQDISPKLVRILNTTSWFIAAWVGLLILAQLKELGTMTFVFWAILMPFAILLWLGLIAAVVTMGLYLYAVHKELQELKGGEEQHEQIGEDECKPYNPLSSGRTSL